ncbi:hypothetical protein HK099_001422 [Clydaea vesicula]|uniref:Uncharacterized protein n=1 Tax=Clydaea vesicula TaxID=447962 RepID=A0AAD5Y3F6_9FUNG|nr:hypothetical protein HK099_001422 [Clydaea vesicula]
MDLSCRSPKNLKPKVDPIILLSGHESEIYTVRFSPNGNYLASAGMDRNVLFWNVKNNTNFSMIKAHKNAILDLTWSRDGENIFTASADKTIGIWNVENGVKERGLKGHTNHVNAVTVSKRGHELLASSSNDQYLKVWDFRKEKNAIKNFKGKYQSLTNDWSNDSGLLFEAGIENVINSWCMRTNKILYRLEGHEDTITGIKVSPDGQYLISNSMDNTVRMWDIKPFSVSGGSRMIKKFEGFLLIYELLKFFKGAPHGFEKNLIKPCWSNDGDFIAVGSGDRSVVVWETLTRRIVYKLPGHKGCVNQVDWHPTEPIIASCSNDKTLFLVTEKRIIKNQYKFQPTNKYLFDKLFANVLKPTKLEPFFFEMKGDPNKFDITVTTMITVDKFDVLLNSMSTFDGYFSVVLHLLDDENLIDRLESLKDFLKLNLKLLESKADIHLIIDKFPRQLNYLRNVARFFSRSELILPLDVDFIVNLNFSEHIKKNEYVYNKLKLGDSVFILPAFEYTKGNIKKNVDLFPKNKEEVKKLGKKLQIFHGSRNAGHLSTNYPQWMKSMTAYKIKPTSMAYEPYAVFNKNNVPWSDERFTGYGNNKAAWWYEIYLSGLEFHVLPEDFVIHLDHSYNEKARKEERDRNKNLFQNYLTELCDRYKVKFKIFGVDLIRRGCGDEKEKKRTLKNKFNFSKVYNYLIGEERD